MDAEAMAQEIQELREFRARTEPEIERISKKQDDQSGKLANVNVEIAELRVDFKAFRREVVGAITNVRWWIMAAIAVLAIFINWSK